jgi:hypothetical protein
MAFIKDGYQSLIYFNALAALGDPAHGFFRERTVTPPALDSNGVLDTTTMRNLVFRSYQPKRLLGVPAPFSAEVDYDPAIFGIGPTLYLNIVDWVVIQFPDGSQLRFYGWIGKFAAKALKEGEMSWADIDVHNSFQDAFGVNQPLLWRVGPNGFVNFGAANAPFTT